MSKQNGPFFNLKAVVQQTGLKPDTLRAWERRYGLPMPRRSEGGHRLYTRQDIETIKWLMARQREGLSIKRAVELWRQIESEGRNPLQTPTPVATATIPALVPQAVGETLLEMRKVWIDACLAYDERHAEEVLAQAFALYPPETVALELLQKAMAHIGEGWYQDKVTVQQEHFCSELATRRLEALVMAAPPPTRPGRILAACPPQEQHFFGLLLLALLLRRRGWEVVYLGANVPAGQLETTIAAIKPQLVILAAQRLHTAATLLETAKFLQEQGTLLAYGGLIFNLLSSLRDRVPGHFLGESIALAPRIVESLMLAPRPSPPVKAVSKVYQQALAHYRERESLIEAQVLQATGSKEIATNHLALANRELALNIDAALVLGDMDYLGTDIDWVKGLLGNYHIPVETLRGYLVAYRQAAQDNLNERGAPVVTWLDNVIGANGFDNG